MSLPVRVWWHLAWRWAQVRRVRALRAMLAAPAGPRFQAAAAAHARAVEAQEKYFRRLDPAPR